MQFTEEQKEGGEKEGQENPYEEKIQEDNPYAIAKQEEEEKKRQEEE